MKWRLIVLLMLGSTGPLASAADAIFIELPFRYVLGGYAKGQWHSSVQAGGAIQKNKNTKFRVFTLKGEVAPLTASKAAPELDVCPDVWLANVKWKGDKRAIAVSAPWDSLPRKVQASPTNDEALAKAALDLLAGKGIRATAARITQHFRVDLDGDGTEEVLFAATRYAETEKSGDVPMEIQDGDYSFIALGRVLDGKLTLQLLEANFFPKSIVDAPIVRDIGGVLDLDGDGGLEVILHGMYYEGGGTTVWSFRKGKAERVLQLDCGV